MVVFSLMIFYIKRDNFFPSFWREIHSKCMENSFLKNFSNKGEGKERENSVVNNYFTEVWGTNVCYSYNALYINKFETNTEEKIYVNCISFEFENNTLSC